MPRLLCFGYGYSARALAQLLEPQGWTVIGTSREPNEPGLLRFDRDLRLLSEDLDGVTHILSSVPPDDRSDPVLDQMWPRFVTLKPSLKWIGYLSSTGVYGDHNGAWVDEGTRPAPTSDRARRRSTAEASWLVLGQEQKLPVHVFRLSGIYGPGRSAIDDVHAGTARRIVKPGHLFGRVHVDDIATTLMASIDKPNPGAIYNVTDDEPAAPADVVKYACDLLRVKVPPEIPFEQAEMSEMSASFWTDRRRVSNARIKRELGVKLAYPTYREGLQAILESQLVKREA
ncbi:MAG TPA: SDR family oxidoreductase [Magnetospirillaceae bacterium]|jgi:nucleoside-diphosphate-sugar epimerase